MKTALLVKRLAGIDTVMFDTVRSPRFTENDPFVTPTGMGGSAGSLPPALVLL
jgi:hypothetical protein